MKRIPSFKESLRPALWKKMRVQVNSDRSIAVDTGVIRYVTDEVKRSLKRFATRLTRVEVHLSDVNSHKFGAFDKRCLVEARPARHRPLSVSNAARTLKQSVGGALTKMQTSLQTFFGRLGREQHRTGIVRRAPSKAATRDQREHAAPVGTKRASKRATKRSSQQEPASGRRPKKKAIYQARRKRWPSI